ncbi:MAG: Cell division protein FtsY [Pseudomonadota bacterium]
MNEPVEKRSLMSRWFGRGAKSEATEVAQDPAKPVEAEPHAREAEDAPAGDARDGLPANEPVREGDVSTAGAQVEAPAEVAPAKTGWFQRLRSGLAKTSSRISEGITSVFTRRKLDADALQDLEDLLIQADLGVETSMRIVEEVSKGRYNKDISPEEVREVLAREVAQVLAPVAKPLVIDPGRKPHVILMVGVNGTGKTTTIGKLANRFVSEGKSVVLAAGDTFRAAAIDQLKVWGDRMGVPVVARDVGADAAGLAYDALTMARDKGADVLMIDTAGRLQNKQALMAELEKVIRVIKKIDPVAPHDVLLVLDATTGQNALSQVEVFQEKAGVTGLVMTKLDGTARGGILVAIAAKFGLPIHAVGVGESADDLQPFVADEFARALALN